MSCTNCDKKDGCEAEKGPQRTLMDEVVARVYPDRTWGRPDDEARFGAGIAATEVKRLARALSTVTKAPTFYRRGADADLCDYVYILCVGREPALIDVRDGLAEPAEDAGPVLDQYLRVSFSSVARMATVQEVSLELKEGALSESPRPGVYDPKLLKRMQKVVGLIEANDIEHIDFGLLDVPREDLLPGEYESLFGTTPALVNYFFFAAPARTQSTTFV